MGCLCCVKKEMKKVKKVKEKTKEITVKVTQAHIDKGWADCGSFRCPIALALKEQANGLYVRRKIIDDNSWFEVKLPNTAKKFSSEQDCGGKTPGKPFSFKITLPVRFLKKKGAQ